MRILLLRIELRQPLLATGIEGEPNSAATQPFLPGSLIRGAAIDRYLRAQGKADLDELGGVEGREAWARFFSRRIRFLNGYIATSDADRRRSFPAPRAWRRLKHGAGGAEGVFAADVAFGDDDPLRDQPQAALRGPFVHYDAHDAGESRHYRVNEHLRVHTTINARHGYAAGAEQDPADPGAVFQYAALAPRQVFHAPVLLDGTAEEQQHDAEWIQGLLAGRVRFGRARTVYGAAQVEIEEVTPEEGACWDEAGVPGRCGPREATDRFTLTLLSHALVRDARGQYRAALGAEEIARVLNRGIAAEARVTVVCTPLAAAGALVGGFNRKWHLPLPQALAVAMGSSFDVTLSRAIPPERLRRLVERGLGERRNEGFGRLALDLPVPKTTRASRGATGEDAPVQAPATLSQEDRDLLARIGGRLLLPALDERREMLARSLEPAGARPSRSAVSRLAQAAQRALELAEAGDAAGAATVWTAAYSNPRGPFRKQLEKPVRWSGGSGTLDSWTRQRFQDSLEPATDERKAATLCGVAPEVDPKVLEYRYRCRALGLLRKKLQADARAARAEGN